MELFVLFESSSGFFLDDSFKAATAQWAENISEVAYTFDFTVLGSLAPSYFTGATQVEF